MSRPSPELDAADRAHLAALHAKLAPLLPAIAEAFYAGTAGPRAELVAWLEAGLLGTAIADRRVALARRHASCALPPLWRTLAAVRGDCDDRIAELCGADARLIARSFDKLLDREIAALVDGAIADGVRSAAADRVASIQTLSTGFAHELRNPINAARLQLEVVERRLERSGVLDPKIADAVAAIDHELDRVARLLQEFLAFARPSELVLGERDVAQLVQGVVTAERIVAKERGVVIAPVDAEPCVVCVDAHKLLQIVQNLVRNAIDASAAGGRVEVAVRADTDHVRIEIADSGPGVPDHVKPRMFEPFFTTKEQGTGLGLSIVHSFVVQHGGTIDVESSTRGARFAVVLPARKSCT
jgi:signal transduction histidine kinase